MLGGLQGLSVGSPPSKCAPLHRQRSPAQEHHLLVHLQGAGQDAGRGDGQHPPRHLRLRHAGELHGGQGVGGFPPGRPQGLHRDRVPPGRSPLSPTLGSWGYPGCAGTGCFGVGARGAGVLGDVVVPMVPWPPPATARLPRGRSPLLGCRGQRRGLLAAWVQPGVAVLVPGAHRGSVTARGGGSLSVGCPPWGLTARGPPGGHAVPVEHQSGGAGETGAREPHQPRQHLQRQDGDRQHAG